MVQSIQCDTSKMSIQTHLPSVMETLVHGAIAEMCKLLDKRSVVLMSLELTEEQGSNEELKTQTQLESEGMMVSNWGVTLIPKLSHKARTGQRHLALAQLSQLPKLLVEFGTIGRTSYSTFSG